MGGNKMRRQPKRAEWALTILFLAFAAVPGTSAGWEPASAQDKAGRDAFAAAHMTQTAPPPFAFVYGGKPSAELLPLWQRTGAVADTQEGVLRRTVTWTDPATGLQRYGNVYSNLLDYVIFSVLIFYVLTLIGLFILRRRRPDAERPYRAFGYPVLPALYIVVASAIAVILLIYKTQTTWPGLAIVLSGIPAYLLWRRFSRLPATSSGGG